MFTIQDILMIELIIVLSGAVFGLIVTLVYDTFLRERISSVKPLSKKTKFLIGVVFGYFAPVLLALITVKSAMQHEEKK